VTDFRLWPRIERLGEEQYFVIVSLVPEGRDSTSVEVVSGTATSPAAAETVRLEMARAMSARVTARGDRIVDVED
jgi:hypothetical protein